MPWICPVCSRSFKNKNQAHSCEVKNLDDSFNKCEPIVKEIFDDLVGVLNGFGPYKISAVKNAIIISTKSTFLAVKLRKHAIDLEFLLDEAVVEFPIYKTVRVSKQRFAHFIRIYVKEDINPQLITLLNRSYELITNY